MFSLNFFKLFKDEEMKYEQINTLVLLDLAALQAAVVPPEVALGTQEFCVEPFSFEGVDSQGKVKNITSSSKIFEVSKFRWGPLKGLIAELINFPTTLVEVLTIF